MISKSIVTSFYNCEHIDIIRLSGPDFFKHVKEYCQSEEWKYFLEKKVQPLNDEYYRGYLANLPTGKFMI